MKRILLAGLIAGTAVIVSSVLLAPVAVAGKPDRERLGPYEPFVDDPGVACPESIAPEGIRWTYAGGKSSIAFYEDGRMLRTGRHPDRVTNVATGESVVLRLQGSAEMVPLEDGTLEWRLSGSTVFTFFGGDVGPGDDATGRIYAFTGNVRLVMDADGIVTAFESSGTMRDVCAQLAG